MPRGLAPCVAEGQGQGDGEPCVMVSGDFLNDNLKNLPKF